MTRRRTGAGWKPAPAPDGYRMADSVAAGDFVVVRVARDADAGGDTATGDAELVMCAIQYTTA